MHHTSPSTLRRARRCAWVLAIGALLSACAPAGTPELRPDVRAHIQSSYGDDPALATALEDAATALTGLVARPDDAQAVRESATDFVRAVECANVADASRAGDAVLDVESMVVDSEESVTAYLRATDQLGGSVFQLRSSAAAAARCGLVGS